MEVSRQQHTTLQRTRPQLSTPDDATPPPRLTRNIRYFQEVTVMVTSIWWHIGDVYRYAGATTAAQKRWVRRELELLVRAKVAGIGKDEGKRGQWWVASAVARERFAIEHDQAIARRSLDTQGQKMDTKRRPMDRRRTNPSRGLRIIAASHDLGWTSDGETRTQAGQGTAPRSV